MNMLKSTQRNIVGCFFVIIFAKNIKMIKSISIQNIKGIQNKNFALDIIPNKPSILVAPNGFGKSSLATAFKSMNNNRIVLDEDDCYKNNVANLPQIDLKYKNPENAEVDLTASNASNTISDIFDYYVINNQIKPKGIGSRFGRASARLEIKDVVLVDRIPNVVRFNYGCTNYRSRFGESGKILPNANCVLTNLKLIEELSLNYQSLERANGDRIQQKINSIINNINTQKGTTETLINWVDNNKLEELRGVRYLNEIANIINKIDYENKTETTSYLLALQFIWLYNDNKDSFKNACEHTNYLLEKQRFDKMLSTFNSTWKNIRTIETRDNQLIVKFPEAIHISNGQRDILSFISMLFRAKKQLKKDANILIIDEVFDYLDDANLIAAQYYISNMITWYKDNGKRIYPLILTHLNPTYFKNYAFKDQKVYYLNKSVISADNNLVKLLRNREALDIKEDVSRFLLHYNPEYINKRDKFRELGISELWGEQDNFYKFLFEQAANYLANRLFCPLAVCGAVRIKIEKIAYDKLQTDAARIEFVETHKTRDKLEKAEQMGVISPESHYLLGIIYNEGMHWKDNVDIISPIAAKLENNTIKKLIRDIVE